MERRMLRLWLRLTQLLLILVATRAFAAAAAAEDYEEDYFDNTILTDKDITSSSENVINKISDSSTDVRLQCSSFCKRSGKEKQLFDPGHRYLYKYEASTSAGVEGTTDGPRLRILATAAIDAISHCQLSLKVVEASVQVETAAAVEGGAGARRAVREAALLEVELKHRPLVFSFADGRIDALCPAADDVLWALNVKRGLLSALQSSGRSVGLPKDLVLERDVSGLCLTKYHWSPSFSADGYTLYREKSTAECAHRAHTALPFPAGAAPRADHSSSPLKGYISCSQHFKSGRLQYAECFETQVLRPFSIDQGTYAGASAMATLSLTFTSKTKLTTNDGIDVASMPAGVRTSLQFEPVVMVEEEVEESSNARELQALVQRVAVAAEAPAESDAPDPHSTSDASALLRRLTHALRRADFPSLQRLFTLVEEQPAERRIFLETLAATRSSAAAALVAHLASVERIKSSEVDSWIGARALRTAPSARELSAITSLVGADASPRVLLAAGAMVHAHCAAAAKDSCDRDSAAGHLVATLERMLGHRCRAAARDEAHGYAVLRALGNAGLISRRSRDVLRDCYQNSQKPLSLRLVAVQALRRAPCESIVSQPLVRLFSDPRENTELRIAAYLQLMRCASTQTLGTVRDVLRAEDQGQVSSFLWSHLNNIKTSSAPWKKDLGDLLDDDFLKEKFTGEALKYSRNYETSTYFDSLDTEATVESNVIFSRESYLPRSADLNLTVAVFGQPINLFEIGGRAEGFESMLEDFFGPRGYYPDASVRDLLSSLKGARDADVAAGLRRLRSAFTAGQRLHSEPHALFYARVFGQEVAFAQLRDAPGALAALRDGNPTAAVGALLSSGAGDYAKTMLMDDVVYTVPTTVGLPLTLTLGASALVRVRAAANWSIADGGEIRAEAELSPSAALAVDAAMTVGASTNTRVGVRLRQRAQAASHTGAAVLLRGGRLAHLSLRAPKHSLHLLNASSTLLLVEDGEEMPARLEVPTRRTGGCSGSTLQRVLGLTACAQVSYPDTTHSQGPVALYPLNGPASLQLSLNKADNFSSYDLHWELEHGDDGTRGLKVSFDTPGSEADRLVRVEAHASTAGPAFHLRLRSPAGGAEVSAAMARNASAASAEARLAVGGAELLRVTAALHWERPTAGPDALTLRPELDARTAGGVPLRLAGELGLMPGARYHARVELKGSGNPVHLQGELRMRDGGYEVLGQVSCSLLNGSLSGNVTAGPGACASDLRVEYATAGGEQHSATWSHGYSAGANSLALNVSTNLSEFPAGSAQLQWELRREAALWEHRLQWEREARVWSAMQRLRTVRDSTRTHLHALAAINCPQRRVDYKVDLEHQVEEGNYSTNGEVVLGWGQRYTAGVQLARAPGPRVVLSGHASTPSARAEIRGRLQKKKHFQGELEGRVMLPRGRNHKLSLTGTYKQEESSTGMRGVAGAQMHQLQLQLLGALRGELNSHVALSAAGVEHALRVTTIGSSRPRYAHFLNYNTRDEKHLFDVLISAAGRNFSASVEAVRTSKEHSTIVRLPFSSTIVLSSKFLFRSEDVIQTRDFTFHHLEVSWDKHLYPNNYVSYNSSVGDSYTRQVFDYPNQNIFGEVINKPGFLSVEMMWDKLGKHRKIKSEAHWNFDPHKGIVSVWMNTPFKGLEKQSIGVNYTNDGEKFHLGVSGEVLGTKQLLEVSGRAGREGNVSASVSLRGAPLPPFNLTVDHSSAATEFSVAGDSASASLVMTREPGGSVTALSAATGGANMPFAPCDLDYAAADGERRALLDCGTALTLRFHAGIGRPAADVQWTMHRFGHARFHFDLVGNNKTAIFETGLSKDMNIFAIGLEHYREAENNFTLKVDTKWKERSLKALVGSSSSDQKTEYLGSISGDLEFRVFHTRHRGSAYPIDFATTIVLPGDVQFNHTFQGKDPLNWGSEARMQSPARTGALSLEAAFDNVVFRLRAAAEEAREGGEKRAAEARLRAEAGGSMGMKSLLLALRPPGATEPLALEMSNGEENFILALRYPPAGLRCNVDIEHEDHGYKLTAFLTAPQTPKLDILTVIEMSNPMSLNLTSHWGNDSMNLEMFGMLIPDYGLFSIHANHSVYGEILHTEHTVKQLEPHAPIEYYAIARWFEKEVLVNMRLNEGSGISRGEFIGNISSPFAGWSYASTNFSYDFDSEIVGWTLQANKEDDTLEFKCKTDFPRKTSILDMEYGFLLLKMRGEHLTGKFDRRDRANQSLEWRFLYDGKNAEFDGAVTRRDLEHPEGGGSIHGVLKTWLTGLKHTEVLLNFTNEQNRELILLLRNDDWRLQANSSSTFGRDKSSAALHILLPYTSPVRHITGTLNYLKQSPSDHQVVTSIICDGQVLETNVSLATSDDEVAAYLDTRSSIHGYGPLTARFNLAGTLNTKKTVQFELANGEKLFNMSGRLSAPGPFAVDGQLSAESTFGARRRFDAELRYDVSGSAADGQRHAWLLVRLPGEEHWARMEANAPSGRRSFNVSLEVASPRAGHAKGKASWDAEAPGQVHAGAHVAVGADDYARPVLDAALSLRDSILSAQIIADTLGLRALSLSAAWAAREPRRNARLHVAVFDHELRAEAYVTHDLLASELQLSAGPDSRVISSATEASVHLHAKYDVSANRSVTVVMTRGDDVISLSGTLTRKSSNGTRAEFYLELARIVRLRTIAYISSSKGSSVELFVEDGNMNRVLHARTAVQKNRMEVFAQSPFSDIRKLNFTGQLDVTPSFKFAGLDLEYMAGPSYLPSTVSAKIDKKGMLFKLNNNHLAVNSVPKDIETTLTYEKLFDRPSNPSYFFVISVNRTKIFKSSANFVFDWEKDIVIDLKMMSHFRSKKWKMELGARCETKFPATIELKVADESGIAVALIGKATAALQGGFTYHTTLSTNYGRSQRQFEVEYYPKSPVHVSLAMNVSAAEEVTSHYHAALFLDAPRALRLELATPLPGYEHLDLNWRRIGDELLLDATTSYPGFERVSLRARVALQTVGPRTEATMKVVHEDLLLDGALLDRGDDLRNATFQLELSGSGANWGVSLAYDVRNANKSVEVTLQGARTRRLTGFLDTERGLQARVALHLPEHTSAVDVTYNSDRIEFRTLLMDQSIVDFTFRREDSDVFTAVVADFHSSVVKHPIIIVYNRNTTENPTMETRVRLEVSALGKTSMADFRMTQDDKSNVRYDIEVDVLSAIIKAEKQIMNGIMQGKLRMQASEKELFSFTIRSNTSMIQDGLLSVALLDGKFMFWKLEYDLRGMNKYANNFVEYNGRPILNIKNNLKIRRDKRIVELSSEVSIPQTELNHVFFNYTMKQTQIYKSLLLNRQSDVHEERDIKMLWGTPSQQRNARMSVEFVGRKKSLFLNIKDKNIDIFSFHSNFEVTIKQNHKVKKMIIELNNGHSKWAFSGNSTWNQDIPLGLNFEIFTPLIELQHFIFTSDMDNKFKMNANVTMWNKNSSLVAQCDWKDGISSSATLTTPNRPQIHFNITATSNKYPSIAALAKQGEKSIFVQSMALRDSDSRINLYSQLTSSWTSPCVLNATFELGKDNYGLIQTYYGSDMVAEVRGKMSYDYLPENFDMSLEAMVGETNTRVKAGWLNITRDIQSGRLGYLEWEAHDVLIKFKFQLEDAMQSGPRRYDALVDMKIKDPLVIATVDGLWPLSGKVDTVIGKEKEKYLFIYTIEEEERSTRGKLEIQTPLTRPFEAHLLLETDINTMTQVAQIESHGYATKCIWRKADIWDLSTEILTPTGIILKLGGSYIGEEIKLNITWPEKTKEKLIVFATRMMEDGYLIFHTPWKVGAIASWVYSKHIKADARLFLDEVDLSFNYLNMESSVALRAASPWGSVQVKREPNDEGESWSASVDNSSQRIFSFNLDRGVLTATKVRVVTCDGAHVLQSSFSRDLRHLHVAADTPRLRAEASLEAQPGNWEAHLTTAGELAPVVLDARMRRDAAGVETNVTLPDVELFAWVKRVTEDQVVGAFFSLESSTVAATLKTRGGANALLVASVRADSVGSVRLEAEREHRGVRFLAECSSAAGRRLAAQASARWGDGRLQTDAAAGAWTAALALSARPLRLEARVGNASLVIREGLVLLVAADGEKHSLEWEYSATGGRLQLDARLESLAVLPERAELRLDIGARAHADGGGTGATVALTSGMRRYSVELRFRQKPRASLEMCVDANGAQLLHINGSFTEKDDRVDAVLYLTLWNLVNSLEVIHRRTFPVHSSVSARSPLLAAGRVAALLRVDATSLEAEASVGEGPARRSLAVGGAFQPEARAAALSFHSSDLHVRSLSLRAALHLEDLGFDAHAHLATADRAALTANAFAALSHVALEANGKIETRSVTGDHKYETGISVPLILSDNTTLDSWVHIPGAEFSHVVTIIKDEFSVNAEVTTHAPNFNAKALVRIRHQPEFSLSVVLDSSIPGFEHHALRVNVPVANSVERLHALEWGTKTMKLSHGFFLQDTELVADVQLATPFEGHERYGIHVAYLNSEEKMAVARVSYPGLERDLVLELEYRVRGLFNVSLHAAFHAPFLPRLRSAAMGLTHAVSFDNEPEYLLVLYGEVNGGKASANLNAQTSTDTRAMRIDFHGTRNDQEVRLHSYIRNYTYSVEVNSTLPALRDLNITFNMDTSDTIYAIVDYNDFRYIHLSSKRKSGHYFNVTCINPWKPFSLKLLTNINMLTDQMNVGWEIDLEQNGTLAPYLGNGVWRNIDEQRVEMGAWVVAAGREARCSGAWEESAGAWERTWEVRWGEKTLGYRLALRRGEGVLRVDLGARALEARVAARTAARAAGAAAEHQAMLLWDAKRDPTKCAGYAVRLLPGGVTLTVLHPLLGNGAQLNISAHLQAEGVRLRAGATLAVAVLTKYGADWRASASLEVAPRRAFMALGMEDRRAARDASAQLQAAQDGDGGVALALNVTYMPGKEFPRRTLVSEMRAAPALLLLRARTREAAVALRARVWMLGAELLAQADDRDAVRLLVGVEPSQRSLSAELELGGGLRWRARAVASHRRRLWAGVWREAAGAGRQSEAHAELTLSSPRLLSASVFWKPQALEKWPLLERELQSVSRAAGVAADAHERLWRECHWWERWDLQVPWPKRADWGSFARQEVAAVADDVIGLANELQTEYERTKRQALELLAGTGEPASAFWGEVGKWAHAVAEATLQWTRAITRAFVDGVYVVADALGADAMLPALGDALAEFRAQTMTARAAILERAVDLLEAAGQAVEDAGQMVLAALERGAKAVAEPLAHHSWELVKVLSDVYFEFILHINDLVDDITSGFMEVKELNALYTMSMEIIQWIQGPFHEYVNDLMNNILEVVEVILSDIEHSVRHLWKTVQEAAPSLPPALRDAYYQILGAWHSWGESAFLKAFQRRRDLLLAQRTNVLLRPDTGVIVITQELPVDWEGFDRAPRFDQLRQIIGGATDDENDDAINRLIYLGSDLASQSPRELLRQAVWHSLSAFSATGHLVGTHHVVTFDGNVYPLQTDCSYLVTGDLVHNTFAIIVNFTQQNSDVKRTFTILTPDNSIVVSSDYALYVDGRPVELPAKLSSFLSLKRFEEAVEVSAPGFTFRCHVQRQVCSVQVSGFHFGHVGGLLGSFDRELADDLAAPSDRAESVGARNEREVAGEVARAWRLGRCRAANRLPTPSATQSRAPDAPACKRMFEAPSSAMSVCHARLDPAPYAELCAILGPCDAALAYSEACSLQTSIKVPIPPECVSCRAPDGTWLPMGASVVGAGSLVDVVLVVQRGCSNRGLQKSTSVPTHLAAVLKTQGVRDVQFAVISYGGAAGTQFHASVGGPWTSDTHALQKTLHRLLSSAEASSAAAGEAEAAVVAAAGLRTRAGAGRTVVLLQCSACARDAFVQLATPLVAANAPLHVLRPHVMTDRFMVLAIGKEAVGVKKDACTAVALESGGSVIDASRFGPSTSFMEEWAQLTAKLVRPAPCSLYHCSPGGLALCSLQDEPPQNSEEADVQFMQFLQ